MAGKSLIITDVIVNDFFCVFILKFNDIVFNF